MDLSKGFFCTCATYGIRDDGKISVFNAGRLHSPTGKANNITGYAYVVDPKFPGKLKVVFPNTGAPAGNYWVMKLGPLNKEGLYSYAVVTSNLRSFLWILVRDVDDYMKNHDAEIQKYVKEKGFTWFWNKPRKRLLVSQRELIMTVMDVLLILQSINLQNSTK